MGETHRYEPDFVVRLRNGLQVLLEIKGFTFHNPDVINAKNAAAKKWVSAVNNLGDFGQWVFHICYEPERLREQLEPMAAHLDKLPTRPSPSPHHDA